jgi:hypothetical protein
VQLLLFVWRWAVELLLLVLVVALAVKVHHHTDWPIRVSLLVVAGFLLWLSGVFYVIPATRGFVPGVFWCSLTRHRMRAFFLQARVFNRSAHLPWILFVRPTPVGERVWIYLVPGLSVEDFTGNTEKIAAATSSRSVRVERHRRIASLVRVDVVRRDPLMTDAVPSVLIPASRRGQDSETAPAVPLDVPHALVDLAALSEASGPVWGTPAGKKNGVNKTLTSTSRGKAALSSQDGATIPSAPPVVSRGGEDVSDYV